ncbi:hypothetical protein [Flavobacterium sp. XGLA_31]|uniref:hypothetical protein n=1 Tax=Flavobacterium sp. XGLA_31 TaxID=3447666 RepID=UPI003F33E9C8
MSLKKFRSLLWVVLAAVLGFAVHQTLFHFLVPQVFERDFIYTVGYLYTFFAVFAIVIVFILMLVKEKSIDNVGFTYLLLTFIKMAVAYVLLLPILETNLPKTPTEKINFFIVFIYFLTIETVVTIRILNNKQ